MGHLDIPQFIGLLVVMLGAAKLLERWPNRSVNPPCLENWLPVYSSVCRCLASWILRTKSCTCLLNWAS